MNRTTLWSKESERVLGTFRQTVQHKSKSKTWKPLKAKPSKSREWSWPAIKSPLRTGSSKRIKSGNYTVKRVGGGYAREPYQEEKKWESDEEVEREKKVKLS